MGDTLHLPYTVDGRVQGTVTIETPTPVSPTDLLNLFQSALRDNGAAILSENGSYRIVPMSEQSRSTAPLEVGAPRATEPGVAPHIISLNYISASNMRQVLEPMLPPDVIVSTDDARNTIILSGTDQEVASVVETISVFDVDWMKGMSFALIPVKASSPTAIVRELDDIFSTRSGPLKGVVRFVPNTRLKAVLVISSRAKYLQKAKDWVNKLDVLADKNEASFHIYHVQNRTAADLAKLIDSILASQSGAPTAAAGSPVAPKLQATTVDSQDGTSDSGDQQPPSGEGTAESPPVDVTAEGDVAPQWHVRVVADDSNNALLIYAPEAEYEKIKEALREMDTVPNQVLLEAVIAEVSLNDELKFGVRWYFGDESNHGTFSNVVTGAVSSVFPGFSYFLKSSNITVALNALSAVTNVRVLSAPSLVVLDNKTATLQVGDQVPIVTQQAQSVTAPDAPVVSNVEMKDTGVILHVTPRVNDSGLVTLTIEQEVSNVIRTTSSGIDSPTIRQRRVKTSVAVGNDEAIALGGLIQERQTIDNTKVPVVGELPILGAAFRHRDNASERTELLIFIRPRVIRDMDEARQVTQEFRQQLSIETPDLGPKKATPQSDLQKIFEQ